MDSAEGYRYLERILSGHRKQTNNRYCLARYLYPGENYIPLLYDPAKQADRINMELYEIKQRAMLLIELLPFYFHNFMGAIFQFAICVATSNTSSLHAHTYKLHLHNCFQSRSMHMSSQISNDFRQYCVHIQLCFKSV